jgi:hypothetical protein
VSRRVHQSRNISAANRCCNRTTKQWFVEVRSSPTQLAMFKSLRSFQCDYSVPQLMDPTDTSAHHERSYEGVARTPLGALARKLYYYYYCHENRKFRTRFGDVGTRLQRSKAPGRGSSDARRTLTRVWFRLENDPSFIVARTLPVST